MFHPRGTFKMIGLTSSHGRKQITYLLLWQTAVSLNNSATEVCMQTWFTLRYSYFLSNSNRIRNKVAVMVCQTGMSVKHSSVASMSKLFDFFNQIAKWLKKNIWGEKKTKIKKIQFIGYLYFNDYVLGWPRGCNLTIVHLTDCKCLTKVMGLKSCLIILDNFASWKCVGFFCFYKTVFKTDYVLFYCYISLKCIKGIK